MGCSTAHPKNAPATVLSTSTNLSQRSGERFAESQEKKKLTKASKTTPNPFKTQYTFAAGIYNPIKQKISQTVDVVVFCLSSGTPQTNSPNRT